MKLKIEPFVSHFIRGAVLSVLFAVAPGCGAPLEGEIEVPTPAAVEEPGKVSAQDLPGSCSQDLEYERLLCYTGCGDAYASCKAMCSGGSEPGGSYECSRQCSLENLGCTEQCDKHYCG